MLRYRLLLSLLLVCPPLWAETRIVVSGIPKPVADNIRLHIGTLSDRELQQPRLLNRKLTTAIRDASEALGYYDPQYQYTLRDDTLKITVQSSTEIRWAPAQIHIEGPAAQIDAIAKRAARQPFTVGKTISHRTYDSYKRELLELCQEYGFLDAEFTDNQLQIDKQQRTATAVLSIDSGKRYRVGELAFSGSGLDTDLLRRLSPLQVGDDYRKSKLTEFYRNLQNSRYFRDIQLRTEQRPDQRIVVQVALTDAPNHELSIGLGFVTDTGPRVRFRWEQPHITEHGHRLVTEAKVSAPEQTLTAEYRIPLERPLDQSLNFTTSWENKDIQDTQSTLGTVGFFFSDRYTEHWTASYGVTYEDESYRQGSAPRQRANYLAPALSLNELVLPAVIDPTSGHKTWLTLAASSRELGADAAFARITAGRKQLIGLWGSHLLVARVEAGAVITGSVDDIPSSQRFFTGGDQTVRGYDFESLSPRDANGELTGGKYLNVASLEYSFKILERWRLAVFTDSGRAFNSKDEPWHSSVGFGVRWLSPVGQIRVDLAAPVNDEKDGVRLHIFMGPPL